MAARDIGVEPAKCAYVGDNLNRDVTGTRTARFGMAIIMLEEQELKDAEINDDNRPDAIILGFNELLELFPGSPMVNSEKLFEPK